MKVTCLQCKNEYVSMGKYFEDNYAKQPDKYVCMRCNSKVKDLPLPSCPVAILLCGKNEKTT